MRLIEKNTMADKLPPIEQTPLGWEIDLLMMMAHACTILTEDIDYQIKYRFLGKSAFDPNLKKCMYNYQKALKEADDWIFKFDLDKRTYDAVEQHNKKYSNVIASANWLIRMCMLAIDRAHCDGGDGRAMKRLRSLPENGLFPEKVLNRFIMKFEIEAEAGDRVRTNNYGDGTLELHLGNANWQVALDTGEKKILNESHFKLL